MPRKLPIRGGYELPPNALVVRGGQMLLSDLSKNAIDTAQKYGLLGISVFAADVPNLTDLLSRVPLPWRIIGVATRGDLSDWELLPTFRAPHYTLRLGAETEEDLGIELELLQERFTLERNPLVE